MGKAIELEATKRKHNIVAAIDKDFEGSISGFKGIADIAIEFSTPESAVNNYIECFKSGIPVVSGTTGWLNQWESIAESVKEHDAAFLYASNFSIGVNLFMSLNKYLAEIMNPFDSYNPDINEIHHIHKLDAPSGTAITLANDMIEKLYRKVKWVKGRADSPEELSITSERIGEVPGIHTITYSSDIDEITITHSALDRRGFAMGAVLAAEFLIGKKGILSMKDLLKL